MHKSYFFKKTVYNTRRASLMFDTELKKGFKKTKLTFKKHMRTKRFICQSESFNEWSKREYLTKSLQSSIKSSPLVVRLVSPEVGGNPGRALFLFYSRRGLFLL